VRRDAPLSYYGIRAANLLGDKPLDVELAASPSTPEEAAARVRKGITRWKLLEDVEWHAAAAFELRRLKQRFADNRPATYEVAEQLQKRGAPHLALGIGRELLQNGEAWNRRLLKIMYPMPFKSLIERHANAHGLDPYFVTAIIRQESRFNNKAMSGAGAVGLMQVMPSTGKQLGKRTKKSTVTVAKLTQPDLNLRLGTKFLSDLMDMYGNRVDAALVAYNAGPSRAYRWRNFPEFATEDLFIERIPFDETREYVKAIKSNITIYRALYGARQSAD
jgi:soluble lytic murein transglycosylase